MHSFDTYAKHYDEHREGWIPYFPQLMTLIAQSKSKRIIDIGCGTGTVLKNIQNYISHSKMFIGIDISINMLEVAKSKDLDSNYLLASALSIPFHDNSFDGIIAIYLLHLLEDKGTFFDECFRILTRSGWIFIVTAPHFFIHNHPLNKFFPRFKSIDLQRFPEEQEIDYLLVKSGFKKIHKAYYVVLRNWYSEEYLHKVRAKFISTLWRIPEDEFIRGLKQMEEAVRNGKNNPPLPWISVGIIAYK